MTLNLGPLLAFRGVQATVAPMAIMHLNTESLRVDDASTPNTGRSSLRSGGSSRRSSRGQSRLNRADKAFKCRQDRAINLFPTPLFDNSNAPLVCTSQEKQASLLRLLQSTVSCITVAGFC